MKERAAVLTRKIVPRTIVARVRTFPAWDPKIVSPTPTPKARPPGPCPLDRWRRMIPISRMEVRISMKIRKPFKNVNAMVAAFPGREL